MKISLLTLGFIAASTLATMAAEPAKMADSEAGTILVDEEGMTLYTFDKDTDGQSVCDADCLEAWPAFYAVEGAEAEGDFSIVQATDGKNMWAYKGMPLYYFQQDTEAGDVNGDGIGGVWHVVK